jgi:hypothetical protein
MPHSTHASTVPKGGWRLLFGSALVPVIRVRVVFTSGMIFISLAGCGPSENTPAPSTAMRPDVIITLDGARHNCDVALYSEPQGSAVSCADVVPFVRDELRLASGSIYDIRTAAKVDDAERAAVEASLNAAGYRFIAGAERHR